MIKVRNTIFRHIVVLLLSILEQSKVNNSSVLITRSTVINIDNENEEHSGAGARSCIAHLSFECVCLSIASALNSMSPSKLGVCAT